MDQRAQPQPSRQSIDHSARNPAAILALAPDGSVTYTNPTAAAWLETRGQAERELLYAKLRRGAARAAAGSQTKIEVNGAERTMQFIVVPAESDGHVFFYGVDVTDEKQSEQSLRVRNLELERRVWEITHELRRESTERQRLEGALRDGEENFQTLVEGSVQGFLIHRDWQPIFANPALARLFGYRTPAEILALDNIQKLYAPHERERLKVFNEARMTIDDIPEVCEFEALRADGRQIWVKSTARVVNWNGTRAALHWFVDVTKRRTAEAQLERLARYDVLTGLANRSVFQSELQHCIAQAGRNGQTGALLLLDLDNFKDVNDSFGHPAGDLLLEQVAQRLASRTRETDMVARLGGDEFAIIANNLSDADGASVIAQTVGDALSQPFQINGAEIFTAASIGITLFPEDGRHRDVLMKNADMALYHAKNSGRGKYGFYNAELNQRALRRKELERALRAAVESDQLTLKFQPKVDILQGKVVGVEALLRWDHPELGPISPTEFIPIAETSGLIVPMGDWVLRKACEQNFVWQAAGLPPVPIAVNLSAVQFKRTDLVEAVGWLIEDLGVDPSWLELEITESMIMENVDSTVKALHGLHDIGVTLAIDDFGTGHSSLAYLKRFPMDKLKIDRSFVNDVVDDADDAAIAQIIINLAKQLNLQVIAEGVETVPQLEFLRQNGCDVVQGYHFSPPIDAEAFIDWYSEFHRNVATAKHLI